MQVSMNELEPHLREADMTNAWKFCVDRIATPLGDMIVVTDETLRLRAAEFSDFELRMQRLLRLHYGWEVTLTAGGAPAEMRARIEAYFAGALDAIDEIEVETGGTDFQRAVWASLRKIPAGATRSYAQLASSVGRPRAVRAVGHANGSNPISVIVPCHRVIGADKQLTGYGGGLHRKLWLLEHEGSLPPEAERRLRQKLDPTPPEPL